MRLEDSLGCMLNVTAKLLKRDLDNRLKQYHLTTTQWAVIKALSENGELTQVEIAEKLNSDQATCGAMIDRMFKRELLQREADEKDRRAYKVSLSDYSKSIVSELEQLAQSTNDLALSGISEEERAFTYRILKNIISNMKEG